MALSILRPSWAHVSLLIFFLSLSQQDQNIDTYNEAVTFRLLPATHAESGSRVLSYFEFSIKTQMPVDGIKRDYHLFPSSVGGIVQQYGVEEMAMSFTSGRWRNEEWGSAFVPAPHGAALWGIFSAHQNETGCNAANSEAVKQIDSSFKALSQALSGVFCASVMNLPAYTSSPTNSFAASSRSLSRGEQERLRYGVSLAEPVCTENLTPWLKLLPSARQKDGITSLLNPLKIYDGAFHSMSLHYKSSNSSSTSRSTRGQVEQVYSEATLTLSLTFVNYHKLKAWSFSDIFGRESIIASPLARTSTVMVDTYVHGREGVTIHPDVSRWAGAADRIGIYDLKDLRSSLSLHVQTSTFASIEDYAFLSSAPRDYLESQSLHVQKYLSGFGDERGTMVTQYHNRHPDKWVSIRYYVLLPWFVRTYFHSTIFRFYQQGIINTFNPEDALLRANANTSDIEYALTNLEEVDSLLWLNVIPARDRERPALLEYVVTLQPQSLLTVTTEYDTSLLYFFEYPPDAHRGFDVGGAPVSYSFHSKKKHISNENKNDAENPRSQDGDFSEVAAVLHPEFSGLRSAEESGKDRSYLQYTEMVRIMLPTPDFSMPYNVIVFTSTAIALFFGQMLNNLLAHMKPLREGKEIESRRLFDIIVDALKRIFHKSVSDPVTLRQDEGEAKEEEEE